MPWIYVILSLSQTRLCEVLNKMNIHVIANARDSGLSLVTLWPGKDAKKLEFINGEDFPRDQVLAGLEIQNSPLSSSFGITDKGAIKARLSLVNYLRQNPLVKDFLAGTTVASDLPDEEEQFLEEFPADRRPFFWQQLEQFIRLVRESDSPPAPVMDLVVQLERMLPFEQQEEVVARKIAESVQKMAELRGTFRFPLEK